MQKYDSFKSSPQLRPQRAIELLEPRRLLSSIALGGTAQNDAIVIAMVGGLMRISNVGPAAVTVNGTSTIAPNKSKSYSGITTLAVDVGAGNDNVTIDASVTIRTTVAGGKGNDTLRGGGGNDSLGGGDGNDQLFGGRGKDTLAGGAGDDLIRGGSSNDVITGDPDDNTPGADTLFGDDGNDSIIGGGGGDAIYGDDNDADTSEDGNDTLRGGAGNDYIVGNGGNDSIFGDGGDDFISALDGQTDTIDGGSGTDRSQISGGDDDVITNVEQDQSIINAQNLNGFYAVFDGTTGNDVLTISQSGEFYTFVLNGLNIVVTQDELQRFSGFQNNTDNLNGLVVRLGNGNDRVTVLTATTLRLEIFGDNGNDTIEGGPGNELLYGGDGNDTLLGNAGNDSITGGSGSDFLSGGKGNDTLEGDYIDNRIGSAFGNLGADTLTGGTGIDVGTYENRNLPGGVIVTLDNLANDGFINENDDIRTDIEVVVGTRNNDEISGSGAGQTLIGLGGNDTLRGLGGNDLLIGDDITSDFAGGNDSLEGGSGNDTLSGGEELSDSDTLRGGDGYDFVDYTRRTNTVLLAPDDLPIHGNINTEFDLIASDIEGLLGGAGDDVIAGNEFANELRGYGGNDTITGGGGNDMLRGGAGNDSLSGENGNDTLFGETGNDTLIGGRGNDSLDGAGGNDRIFNRDSFADVVTGGAGVDTAEVDGLDSIVAEVVQ